MCGRMVYNGDLTSTSALDPVIHEGTSTLCLRLTVMTGCDIDGSGVQSGGRGRMPLNGLLLGQCRSSGKVWTCGQRIIFATCTTMHVTTPIEATEVSHP